MAKYVQRSVEVDAFQLTMDGFIKGEKWCDIKGRGSDPWPEWFRSAWDRQYPAEGSIEVRKSGVPCGTLVLSQVVGWEAIAWDDWIVRGPRGHLSVVKPHLFDLLYQGLLPGIDGVDLDGDGSAPVATPESEILGINEGDWVGQICDRGREVGDCYWYGMAPFGCVCPKCCRSGLILADPPSEDEDL